MEQGIRPPISLRQLILTRISVLVVATTLLVAAGFVWFGLLPMAEQIARDQFDAVTTRVDAELDTLFALPTQLLGTSRGWLGGQAPDLDSPEVFNRLFRPVLETSPQITSVVAGTSTGQGWLLLRQADGSWRNRMTDITKWGNQRHRLTDHLTDGSTTSRWGDQTYDPRARPWFKAALAGQDRAGVHWTSPYTFFTTGDPGITASSLMRLSDGRDFVLGFDLMLRSLSQSTLRAVVGQQGLALVMTEDERVLALPARPATVSEVDWLKRVLKPVSELGLVPVSDAIAHWHRTGRNAEAVLNYPSAGVRWLASVHPYRLGEQQFWVVTLAPAADFSPAWLAIILALALALSTVLLLAIFMAWRETARLTRPLETLAKVNEQIGQLDFQARTPINSRISEIRQLAGAQDTMLSLLQSNQQKLNEQAQDLRERVAALIGTEARLKQQYSTLSTIIENFPGGVSVCDAELHLTTYNAHFKTLLKLPDSLFQKPVLNFEDFIRYNALRGDYGPGDPEQQVATSVARARNYQVHKMERILPDGTALEIRGMPLPEGGFVTLYIDITERKRAEEKLKFAASVFTYAREGITITAADGTILDVNETFTRITGYSRNEVLGQNPRILKSDRQGVEFYADMWRELIEKDHWSGELWNRRKNGEIYAELLTISAVRNAQGSVSHYVALFSDITTLKDHQRDLEHIAHFDALTGLPNRMLLADRMHQSKVQAIRRSQRLAVAYLDLDGFKKINDMHGHDAGDQLLVVIAERMKQALREGDTLARLGGDEFVAVLLDLADVEASVPMLKRLLAAAAEPVQVGELLLQVSASLGVTFFPQAETVDADMLLRQADQAMYQAKQAGKNRYHVFDAEQDRNVRGHHESLERIRRALTAHEFVLHYQPKVNMRTGLVVGAEALIRWQHPEKGLLAPAVFLPVIEDHPLAIDVGEWVIDTALTQLELWHAAGLDIPVSVNVGARQLQQAGFVDRLRSFLTKHPFIQPGNLELEVLETSALEDISRVSQVIEECRKIGVSFSLDDFGTGYSSLTYLKRLPVTLLKIDQSFVRDMLDDPDDLSILDGVLALSKAFNRAAMAEGVETVAHGAMLLQLGCELAQGYGIARPMPGDALPAWVVGWRIDPSWESVKVIKRADLPLLFAAVGHRAWINVVGNYLSGAGETPMPPDIHQCHLGQWIDAAGHARFSTHPVFLALGALHQQVHELAQHMFDLHAQGQNQQAQERLPELHRLRDLLLQQISLLMPENSG